MTNEEKILELLLQMQVDIAGLKIEVSEIKVEQTEMKADMHERFDRVEFSINQAWKDLGIVEDRVDQHETLIQKKIM